MIAFAAILAILLADARRDEAARLSPSQFALVVPFLLSVLYSVLDVRQKVDPNLFSEVNRNVELRLFNIRDNAVVPDADLPLLQTSNGLMNLFWKLIDNEKSLDKKSQGVMHNGLFVTSLLDGFIVLLLTAPFGIWYAYWSASELDDFRFRTVLVSGVLVFVALASRYLLLPQAQKKHLELSNEQLDYIEEHLGKEARKGISDLWYRLREAP